MFTVNHRPLRSTEVSTKSSSHAFWWARATCFLFGWSFGGRSASYPFVLLTRWEGEFWVERCLIIRAFEQAVDVEAEEVPATEMKFPRICVLYRVCVCKGWNHESRMAASAPWHTFGLSWRRKRDLTNISETAAFAWKQEIFYHGQHACKALPCSLWIYQHSCFSWPIHWQQVDRLSQMYRQNHARVAGSCSVSIWWHINCRYQLPPRSSSFQSMHSVSRHPSNCYSLHSSIDHTIT